MILVVISDSIHQIILRTNQRPSGSIKDVIYLTAIFSIAIATSRVSACLIVREDWPIEQSYLSQVNSNAPTHAFR